jgi:hypothetical protein
MRKYPDKIYIVNSRCGMSKPYKSFYHAKKQMRSDSDVLITYNIESENTLKSMKREKRLSSILDGEDSKIDPNIISLFKKYSINLRLLNTILDKDDLKRLVVRNKRKLFLNLEDISEFEDLFKFHNFQKYPHGLSDEKISMINTAKENIKKK